MAINAMVIVFPILWKTGEVHIRMILLYVFPSHLYRPSDIRASYLEGNHSPPSGSSHSSQSDPEPMERFALSFRDDM